MKFEASPSSSCKKTTRDLFDTSYLAKDLRGRSVRSGAATVLSQGCSFVLRTASTMIMARLLTPADFGLIAMVATVTNFAMMFQDLGLSAATIQRAEINHDQVSTLFWINTALGVLVCLVVTAMAPGIAWFFEDSRLIPVTTALSTMFIFSGLGVQHSALLQRHMCFLSIGVIQISSMLVSVLVGIVSALLGVSYWSLVFMQIAGGIVVLLGKWIAMPWMPGVPKKGVGIKQMLHLGSSIAGFNIINYFARNADNILIGKMIGDSALGYYSKAYGLLMMPITQIRNPVNAVAIPALSRLQSAHEKFSNYYLKIVSIIAFLTMPMMVYMFVFAYEIVVLMLGEQWVAAASIFQVLAIAAFIQPVASTTGMVLVSLSQGNRYLKWGLINSIITVFAFAIGIFWGALGVALAYTVVNYILFLPSLWYCFKETPVTVGGFLKAVSRPILVSIVTALVLIVVSQLITFDNTAPALIVGLLTCGLTYLGGWMLIPGGRQELATMLSYLNEFRKK